MFGSHLVGLTVRLLPGTGATLSAGVGTETAVTARTGTTVTMGVGQKKALVGRRAHEKGMRAATSHPFCKTCAYHGIYKPGGEKESHGFLCCQT